MRFISTEDWRDNTDGHLYRKGEPFPFDGREISPERLAELENGTNRAGLRLIQGCEAGDERTEVPKAEAPKKASEGRKTAVKKPRKTTK